MVTGKQPPNKKRRKGWTELSESYRKRLERGGIGRKEYEFGVSLSKARGHAKTPERPSQAYKGRTTERYGEYRQKRRAKGVGRKIKADWITEAIEYTQSQLGDLRWYNHNTVIVNAERKTIAQLQRTLLMSKDELQAEARPQIATNVWWYH